MPPISLPVVDRRSIDNSVGQTYCRCPRLAFYNYRLNRASTGKNFPILFGSAYHNFREILELLYMKYVLEQNEDLEDLKQALYIAAFKQATEGWEDPPLEHKHAHLDYARLEKTCKSAFESWLNEKRQGYYKVIATEAAFEIPLPSGRIFSGLIDQQIEWNGRLWIRDFKTTSRKEDFTKKFNPSHQFTGYVWAAQQLSGRRVEGVIIENVYNTKTKGPEFIPTLASRTTADIDHWLEWIEHVYDRWEESVEKEFWPMYTSACGDFGGCFFREACNSGSWPTIERFLEQRTVYSEWDPMDQSKEVGLPQ